MVPREARDSKTRSVFAELRRMIQAVTGRSNRREEAAANERLFDEIHNEVQRAKVYRSNFQFFRKHANIKFNPCLVHASVRGMQEVDTLLALSADAYRAVYEPAAADRGIADAFAAFWTQAKTVSRCLDCAGMCLPLGNVVSEGHGACALCSEDCQQMIEFGCGEQHECCIDCAQRCLPRQMSCPFCRSDLTAELAELAASVV